MGQWPPVEHILVRRAPLLQALAGGPVDKSTLRETLSVSRSTVDRGVRDLEAAGFVEHRDGEYRLTLAGRLAFESVDQFTARLAGIESTTDLFADLDHELSLSPAVVSGAEVVRPTQTAPNRPFERIESFVERADEIRGVLSAVSERHVDLYSRRIDDGLTVSLVVTPTVTERLASEYGEQAHRIFSSENATFRELDERYPFGLTLGRADGQTQVALTVYGDYGVAGVLVNDAADAVAWGEAFFDDAWERATPFPNA